MNLVYIHKGAAGCLCRPCPWHTKVFTVKTGLVERMRRSESKSAARRYLLPWAVLLMIDLPTAHAQGAYSPVRNSPAFRLDRDFGHTSFGLGQARGFSMNQEKGAPTAPIQLGSGRGSSYGGGAGRRPRGQPNTVYQDAFAGGTRLLGEPAGPGVQTLSLSKARPGSLLNTMDLLTFRGYNPFYRGSQTDIDRAQAKYASWGSPEIVAKRKDQLSPTTRPTGEQDDAATIPKLTMKDLVRNQLSARRETHETRAKQAMKTGEYQQACDELVLADASVMNDPDTRVYLKLMFAYACIAAQQYDEALNAISWVLSRDPKEGGNSVPLMLNKLRDVPSMYAQLKDYTDRGAELDLHMARQDIQKSPAPATLKAMVAWGKNDTSDAKFSARMLADQVNQLLMADKSLEQGNLYARWLRLYDYMQLADQGGQPAVTAKRTKETEKRPGPVEPGRLTLDAVPNRSPSAGQPR